MTSRSAIADIDDFFKAKPLSVLKAEDRSEKWYEDFISFLRERKTYAKLLAPKKFGSPESEFDLSKICEFVERLAYFSPAHGYSFQVSFLGIYPLLMSKNEKLKAEAVQALERGGLFAFGLSEKEHGSDVYSSEMIVDDSTPANFKASGAKYYIGNANCADIISVLGIKKSLRGFKDKNGFMFFAYRPQDNASFKDLRKIPTLGVKTAFVGAFAIENHSFPALDVISEGQDAWDAIFGTVNLGKFFLGFGSIGICRRALEETLVHVKSRVLYGKPVYEMPHIRRLLECAEIKLANMRLFSRRALDYLIRSNDEDRRYLLYNSVQKAKVSTEGIQVLHLLSECMGAKGFETENYFESAFREIHLIPGLEGSTHINHLITNAFSQNYFFAADPEMHPPGHGCSGENEYLFRAKSGGFSKIGFAKLSASFAPIRGVRGVSLFLKQMRRYKLFLLTLRLTKSTEAEPDLLISTGKVMAQIAYAQLIAESCASPRENLTQERIDALFIQLVEDLNLELVRLAASPPLNTLQKSILSRAILIP